MGFLDSLADGFVKYASNSYDKQERMLNHLEHENRDNPRAMEHLSRKREEFERNVENFKDSAERYYDARDSRNN